MYLTLKLLHITAVVLFIGNITTGLFWHHIALKTSNRQIIAHTIHGVIRSDRLLTGPMVMLIVVSGLALAEIANIGLGSRWLLAAISAFAISGICFGVKIAPLQKQMHRYAEESAEFNLSYYRELTLRWERWGLLALLTPFISMGFMVFKPF